MKGDLEIDQLGRLAVLAPQLLLHLPPEFHCRHLLVAAGLEIRSVWWALDMRSREAPEEKWFYETKTISLLFSTPLVLRLFSVYTFSVRVVATRLRTVEV